MKNQIATAQMQTPAQLQAKKAIQSINHLFEKHSPLLSEAAKSKLVVECLIEISVERRLLQFANK